MPKSKSVTEREIPLYLLPRAIALQINRRGDSVYRISVKRTHWHHYNISVRTRSLPKELAAPRPVKQASPEVSASRHTHDAGEPDCGCDT